MTAMPLPVNCKPRFEKYAKSAVAANKRCRIKPATNQRRQLEGLQFAVDESSLRCLLKNQKTLLSQIEISSQSINNVADGTIWYWQRREKSVDRGIAAAANNNHLAQTEAEAKQYEASAASSKQCTVSNENSDSKIFWKQ